MSIARRSLRMAILAVLILPAASHTSFAQNGEAEHDAIRATILDYAEGWYDGDVDRMDSALHPELVKRIVFADPRSGRSLYNQASKTLMMEYTRMGMGKKDAASKEHITIDVLDVEGDMALAKSVTPQFIDYMQLAKWNGAWKIVNVLWKQTPPKE